MTAQLTVYVSKPAAPLCERVLDYLDRRGYQYTTIDVASDQDRAAMRQHTGYTACPLVLAGDHVIGKLEDTIEADRSGRLATLLGRPDSPAREHDGGNHHA